MMRHLTVAVLAALASGGPGCDATESHWPAPSGGEVVPAGPEPAPGEAVAARYWYEFDPSTLSLHTYRLYPGNVIYRNGVNVEDVTYNFGNTVTLSLHTPQDQLTYRDHNGICYVPNGSGGRTAIPCPSTWPTACLVKGAFCGPIQAINNTGNLLPDVVIAVTAQSGTNPVTGCGDADGSRCKPNGDKLASFNTTSTPAINNCAYCYGNPTKAHNACADGLQDGMRSGDSSGTLLDVNTDIFALDLSNDMTTGVTFTARYAVPSVADVIYCKNASGGCTPSNQPSCITPTRNALRVDGSGFGLAGECYGTPTACPSPGTSPVWCPQGGTLLPQGATVTFTGTANPVSVILWSDTQLRLRVPPGATTGPATITTSVGTITTPSITICP